MHGKQCPKSAISSKKAPALTKRAPGLSAQKIIDEIHNVNGIAILAHPAWSLDAPKVPFRRKTHRNTDGSSTAGPK